MKECPDLTRMSTQEKESFWSSTDPRDLKRLGDRLLAESLPHVPTNKSRQEISQDISSTLDSLAWPIEQVAKALGLNQEILFAWEEDRVRPPECLPMVLKRLEVLSQQKV